LGFAEERGVDLTSIRYLIELVELSKLTKPKEVKIDKEQKPNFFSAFRFFF